MRRAAAVGVLVGTLLLWGAPTATAHPLGNFTVNRYAEVVLRPGEVVVHYVLDLAEIPAFQEEPTIDTDADGIQDEELRVWAEVTARAIADDLLVTVERQPVGLLVHGSRAEMHPGQGGLTTLRLEATLRAPVRAPSGSLTFQDRNDPGRLGWREITATSADGVSLVSPTVPATSVSGRLRSYPKDLLSSPLSVTTMRTGFRPGPSLGGGSVATDGSSRPVADGGPLASVVAQKGFALMMFGLLIAVAFGAWHALLPGHGKTLMAAAMVGSGARARQAIVAGVAVALMHTVAVIGLGFLVLALEHAFRPEVVYPWLGILSGVTAAAIGSHLLRTRWRAWRSARADAAPSARAHGDDDHNHDLASGDLLSRRGIAALAFAGGILPAPSALLVMLASIQAQRVVYGLGLVMAFSLGLAVSLIVVGLGIMRVRRAVEGRVSVVVRHLVPVLAAASILCVGLYLVGRGITSA